MIAFLRFSRRCQFQALDNLVDGVAAVGGDSTSLHSNAGSILPLLANRAGQAGRWGLHAGSRMPASTIILDSALWPGSGQFTSSDRIFVRLMVAGAGFDHDG